MSAIEKTYGISPLTTASTFAFGRESVQAAYPASETSPLESSAQDSVAIHDSRNGGQIPRNADEVAPRETEGASDAIAAVMEEMNDRISLLNRSMRFRVNSDTHDIQIQIIDNKKNAVIRTIPSEEMLRIASRMRQFASANGIGLQFDLSS